jgi:hypothetical protein
MNNTPLNPLEGFLSKEDYCKAFGISIRTEANQRALRKGPPFYKIGNRIYYKQAEVVAWIEQTRVEVTRHKR